MLNPISLPVTSYSQVNYPYQPCNGAGLSHVSALSYMQARNLLLDRETPSVTLIGKVFDAVMDAAPVHMLVRGLDFVGRYIFDVCETPDFQVSKKRLNPTNPVLILSGGCTTEIAIKSLSNAEQVNDTVQLSVLQKDMCFNWNKSGICLDAFYETYFIDKIPSYDLYNFSDSLGSNEWNYTNRSWQVSCKGEFDLPASFVLKVQQDIEQVIICTDKKTKGELIYLGMLFASPIFVGLTIWGVAVATRCKKERDLELHLPEMPTPIYGTFAL